MVINNCKSVGVFFKTVPAGSCKEQSTKKTRLFVRGFETNPPSVIKRGEGSVFRGVRQITKPLRVR